MTLVFFFSSPVVEFVDEDGKENDSETNHSDTGSGSSSPRARRNSFGRLAPREGQMLNETIKAHAIEADEVLHSSMEEDDIVVPASLSKTRVKFHSTTALPDKPSTSANSQFSTEITPSFPSLARPRVGRHSRLGKAKSTPLSLNQIHEERESDLEDSPVNSPRVERTRKHLGGGVMKSKRTTRRLSPVPPGGSRRSSSCSSSDEDEIEKHMRRLKTTSGCKLSSRRANNDDGNSDGDNGGGTGVGGGSSLGPTLVVPSENGSSGEQSSSNKNPPSKQESNGKNNCLNLNGFVPLCENLDVIEESNKENVDNNMNNEVEELEIKDKTEVCNGKRSPLIEEYGVLACKEEAEQDRNCFLDKRTSASKYIRKNRDLDGRTLTWNNDSEQECNRNKRNSLEGVVNIELTDMSLQSRDSKRLVEDTKKNMRLLQNPAIQTVTSNCCQIF